MDQIVSVTPAAGATPAPSITMLALKTIVVSPTEVQKRRRQHYNKDALAELAINVKAMGVIEPIIVRRLAEPRSGTPYEIVAGERRWLASQKAGLNIIPSIVRTLDDQQVLEIQLIENLQREGLHELEEAEGYELLMQTHGYGVDELIAKLGKSRAYIYARIKLLALGKKAREALYAGTLNASTALLLARIPVAKLQDEALKLITSDNYHGSLSFREAQRQIQDRYMLRLNDANFDKTDAALVPAAGACGVCPKRTGNQPELFGDVKSADVCTDPDCFTSKRAAWGKRIEADATAAGRTVLRGDAAKRIAPHGVHRSHGGYVSADGLQGGYVALDATHYQDLKQRTYRTLIGKALGDTTLLEDTRSGEFIEIVKFADYADTLKDKGIGAARLSGRNTNNDQRAREKAARVETAWRERVFIAIRAKTPNTIAGADLRLAARALWNAASHEHRVRLVRICDWAGKAKPQEATHAVHKRIDSMTESELRRLLIDCALLGEIHASTWSNGKPEALIATAQRLRIDTGKIRQALKDELAAKGKGRTKAGVPKATPESVAATARQVSKARTTAKASKTTQAKKPAARKKTKRAK